MAKDELIELEGEVTAMNHSIYTVKVSLPGKDEGVDVSCKLSGKLRMNYIRVLVGDKVKVQVSPYDMTKGIISWRYK